jgi:hypothetical protein
VSNFKQRRLTQGSLIQTPKTEVEPSDDEQRPKFCLQYIANGFCVSDCTKDEKAAFASRLREMSQLTWQQLRQAPREKQGYEKIERNAIKVSIPKTLTPEVNIIAFRCFGKGPVIGYRSKAVFHIVWLDPNFKVYKH